MSWYHPEMARQRPSVFTPRLTCTLAPGTSMEELVARARSPWSLNVDHAALAENPNTPLRWLLELAVEYPSRVVNNPAFHLSLLTQPDLLKKAPLKAQIALVGWWEIHPSIIRLLASSQQAPMELRCAAATNPQCPPDLLWAYLLHARPVRLEVRHNPRASRDLIREIHRMEQAREKLTRTVPKSAYPAGPVDPDELLPFSSFAPAHLPSWSERWRRRSIHRLRRP